MIASKNGSSERKNPSGKTKFDNKMYVRIYQLARDGLKRSQIAENLGVGRKTLEHWMQQDDAVRDAFKKGRGGKQTMKKASESFKEYVYKRLPPELKSLWDKIESCDAEATPNTVQRVQAMLANQGKYARMHLFLHALICSNFNASEACRKTDVSLKTFDLWTRTDPDFARLVDEIDEHRKNFYEAALVELVDRKDTAAVIFANKTYNRDRGYSERQIVEVQQRTGGSVIDLDQLELPLEVRKQILLAVRKQREMIANQGKVPALEYVVKDGKGVPIHDISEEDEDAIQIKKAKKVHVGESSEDSEEVD